MSTKFKQELGHKTEELQSTLDSLEKVTKPLWEAFELAGEVQGINGDPLLRVRIEGIVSRAIKTIGFITREKSYELAQSKHFLGVPGKP